MRTLVVITLSLTFIIAGCKTNAPQTHEEIPVFDSFKSQWPDERIKQLETRTAEVLQKEFGVSGRLAELRFQYTPTESDISTLRQTGLVLSAQSQDQYCCGVVCRCCPVECKTKCYKW